MRWSNINCWRPRQRPVTTKTLMLKFIKKWRKSHKSKWNLIEEDYEKLAQHMGYDDIFINEVVYPKSSSIKSRITARVACQSLQIQWVLKCFSSTLWNIHPSAWLPFHYRNSTLEEFSFTVEISYWKNLICSVRRKSISVIYLPLILYIKKNSLFTPKLDRSI